MVHRQVTKVGHYFLDISVEFTIIQGILVAILRQVEETSWVSDHKLLPERKGASSSTPINHFFFCSFFLSMIYI